EKCRGYGSACLRGIAEIEECDIILFVDADGSDYPEEWPNLVLPIVEGKADFVVGCRTKGDAEPGSMLPQAVFGNWLATSLMRMIYPNSPFTDLGPFRAIRRSALDALGMEDKTFGWTVEMQLKALRHGLLCLEVPVSYRKRLGGRSKVTGTVKGTILAGYKILSLVLKEALCPHS
ncbi:MAG: glycosyltransferase family 2 protein, partial [Candidatus Dadabacteria bacterium]